MSFWGICGNRHGVVIERCDPSSAARDRIGRAAARRAGWRFARITTLRGAGAPRPIVPSTEK
ncbi:hypothetical protein C5O80_15455 [Burkholderia sp. SRS-46]|nr:hypothetical protein C5O80_15455 [Burkholderia sp. SRS-46]